MCSSDLRCIADASSGIDDLKLKQRGGSMTQLLFLVEVEDRKHLAAVIRSLRSIDGVAGVSRRNQVGLGNEKTGSRALGETLRDFFSRKSSTKSTDKKV